MRWFTPPELAKELRVDAHFVLDRIRDGELAAVNVASDPHGRRPRWRISDEALQVFLARRAATPPTIPARRRRQPDEIIQFF
jgi:hypothetical protein